MRLNPARITPLAVVLVLLAACDGAPPPPVPGSGFDPGDYRAAHESGDTAAYEHEDRFVAAARTVIDFLRGEVGYDAVTLSDTVTFYLPPEGGGGTAKVPAADLRDRAGWRIRSAGGQVYALVPPASASHLDTRFGRHMRCFEYDLADDFAELARLPHVGTMLEPSDRTSCLQSWNLTLVFQADTLPPRLVAAVYDQWEW